MNFEVLENFNWYNEPENVRFEDDAMLVFSKSGVDFWQSIQSGIKKDDAHFFYCRKNEDFSLTLKWSFTEIDNFSQCGIMLRIDERNWFKAYVTDEDNDESYTLASVLTVGGHSNWFGIRIDEKINNIWFRLTRSQDNYVLYYSLDGIRFMKKGMFYLKSYEDVKVGAFIASPNKNDFFAQLSDIQFDVC